MTFDKKKFSYRTLVVVSAICAFLLTLANYAKYSSGTELTEADLDDFKEAMGDQLGDAEFVGTDIVHGRDGAAEDVICSLVALGLFNSIDIIFKIKT